MGSRLGCDMAFGLKCPTMCFMSRLSLSRILKKLATFLSFIIHWKGGVSIAFDAYYIWRHCHLWKSGIFGMCLVGCLFFFLNLCGVWVLLMGFRWSIILGSVVCCFLLMHFVVGGEHKQLWEATNAR